MAIRVGDSASRRFVVDAATMRWFQEVAQDTSRIHCDRAFAQARGYADVVVNVSAATGVVEGRFSIMAAQRKVATGTTRSIVPLDQIQA